MTEQLSRHVEHNLFSRFFQLDAQQASITGRLIKLSLTIMAGGAAVYYVHVRSPTTIPSLLSKLRPQAV